MRLSRSDLIALARKYHSLSELRRSQYNVRLFDYRFLVRRLAHEFPGALRELDILPLIEIERRAEVLLAASEGGVIEPWMEWMHSYHLMMRAALAIKKRLEGRRVLSEPSLIDIAGDVSRESGVRCDIQFVREVANPPLGRVNTVIFRRLSVEFGAAPSALGRVLFPDGRAGRG
jgi:hypothetical protein